MFQEVLDFVQRHSAGDKATAYSLDIFNTGNGYEIRLLNGKKTLDLFPVPGKSIFWAREVAEAIAREFRDRGIPADIENYHQGAFV